LRTFNPTVPSVGAVLALVAGVGLGEFGLSPLHSALARAAPSVDTAAADVGATPPPQADMIDAAAATPPPPAATMPPPSARKPPSALAGNDDQADDRAIADEGRPSQTEPDAGPADEAGAPPNLADGSSYAAPDAPPSGDDEPVSQARD
jgi:hypothetical protein